MVGVGLGIDEAMARGLGSRGRRIVVCGVGRDTCNRRAFDCHAVVVGSPGVQNAVYPPSTGRTAPVT
jgi:flavorubredoxin